MSDTTAAPERRAATFELFFDLMFVFAITQITHLIETAQSAADWISALSVLLFLWWMYGGFVWLASHARNLTRLAVTLLVAMLGFFLLAAGIPGLHGGDAALAGIAALFVVAVHIAGFALLADGVTGRVIVGFAWVNVAAALLIFLSGLLPHGQEWVPQLAVIALLLGMATLYAARSFSLVPSHFVERHGLLLIIVFGESIIAVGTGLGEHPGGEVLVEAALVIVLVIALWLSWFNYDDRRSEEVLAATPDATRGRAALVAYWAAFAVMIFGILLLAAGMKLHFEGHANPARWIAGALALYFAGMALFRWELGLAGAVSRLAGAVLALLIWLLGSGGEATSAHESGRIGSAVWPLLYALLIAVSMLVVDRLQFGPKTEPAE